jgi:hypothetical protein
VLTHLVAVLGLGAACGLWFVLQRWIASLDPDQPGVEGSKGCGGGHGSSCELSDAACAGCSEREGCVGGC